MKIVQRDQGPKGRLAIAVSQAIAALGPKSATGSRPEFDQINFRLVDGELEVGGTNSHVAVRAFVPVESVSIEGDFEPFSIVRADFKMIVAAAKKCPIWEITEGWFRAGDESVVLSDVEPPNLDSIFEAMGNSVDGGEPNDTRTALTGGVLKVIADVTRLADAPLTFELGPAISVPIRGHLPNTSLAIMRCRWPN